MLALFFPLPLFCLPAAPPTFSSSSDNRFLLFFGNCEQIYIRCSKATGRNLHLRRGRQLHASLSNGSQTWPWQFSTSTGVGDGTKLKKGKEEGPILSEIIGVSDGARLGGSEENPVGEEVSGRARSIGDELGAKLSGSRLGAGSVGEELGESDGTVVGTSSSSSLSACWALPKESDANNVINKRARNFMIYNVITVYSSR